MSMEFVMGNSLETLPKTIDFNFEELKGQLAESLALYTGLVVTEDGIKGAKEDRAKLNKLREALENKRKEVKRECMAPYTDFEAKVKELVGLIDQPIAAIDAQLKEYEEKRRADKRAAILEIYEETVGELRALLPFEKLWQDTWYNTSVTMKKVREAIVAAEDKAASDLEVLATVESEFAEAVKIKYLEHLDLNEALMERSRLQERAKRLREYEAQRAAQAANLAEEQREAEVTRGAEQTPDPAANAAQAGTWEPGGGEAVEEAIYLLRFECQVTKDQAAELSRWLKERNISYKEKQSKAEEKKAKQTIFADFASGDADLLSALQDFEAMRNKIKKPMTDQAKKRLVTELEKLAPGDRDAQIAILHQSEDRCWAGVFALKDDRPYQPSRSGRPQQASTGEKMDALRDLHDEFSGL